MLIFHTNRVKVTIKSCCISSSLLYLNLVSGYKRPHPSPLLKGEGVRQQFMTIIIHLKRNYPSSLLYLNPDFGYKYKNHTYITASYSFLYLRPSLLSLALYTERTYGSHCTDSYARVRHRGMR